MSFEFGITIEKIANVKYHKSLCELLEFDDYLKVDTYTPIYWCGDKDLDFDIRLSLTAPFSNEPAGYVKLTVQDIDNIISLFKYRIDTFKKMKHLLNLNDAQRFANDWARYEEDIKVLKRIRALMLQKDFKDKDGGVYYFTSY